MGCRPDRRHDGASRAGKRLPSWGMCGVSNDRLILTHGCSLSNLPLFVAVGEGLFADEGLRVEAPYFDDISSTADLLATGVADLGTAAFTQPLIDAFRPDPPVMVAGSGLMGISVLTREPVVDAASLAGEPVGTFRSGPMEVLLHDGLAAARRQPAQVDIRDMTPAVFGRWDSLRSLNLVPDDAMPPVNAVMFDLLNDELNAETAKETAK